MDWWQAVILGIVEGLTEYLPVSSTGHLILTAWLMGLGSDAAKWEAAFSFNIVIQIGAIAAVLGLYRVRIMQMLRGIVGKDELGKRLAINLIVAFLPAAALGPLLKGHIHAYLNGPWPVVGALFVGAWLMLVCGNRNSPGKRDIHHITWRIALLIGFGQCVAMWPGTSRSMMTIVTAMLLGIGAKDSAEFSFLLGLITLTAATSYEMLTEGHTIFTQFGIMPIVIGIFTATICAAVAVKWFVNFLTKYGLAPFGWYRLVLACVVGALLLLNVFTVPAAL